MSEDGSVKKVHAYVLVNTEPGKAASVVKQARDIDGVDIATDLAGPYDAIIRACAGSLNDLGSLVVAQIQRIDGVTRTLTCPEMSTM